MKLKYLLMSLVAAVFATPAASGNTAADAGDATTDVVYIPEDEEAVEGQPETLFMVETLLNGTYSNVTLERHGHYFVGMNVNIKAGKSFQLCTKNSSIASTNGDHYIPAGATSNVYIKENEVYSMVMRAAGNRSAVAWDIESTGVYNIVADFESMQLWITTKEIVFEDLNDTSVKTPVITVDGNMVSIKGGSRTKIFYTVDGSEPSTDSTPYTEPFNPGRDCTVKAVAFKGDNNEYKSETATWEFAWKPEISVTDLNRIYVAGPADGAGIVFGEYIPEDGEPVEGQPAALYMVDNLINGSYSKVTLERRGHYFVGKNVDIKSNKRFQLCTENTSMASTKGDHYIPVKSGDNYLVENEKYSFQKGSGTGSGWNIQSAGTYNIIVDFKNMQMWITTGEITSARPEEMAVATPENAGVSCGDMPLYYVDVPADVTNATIEWAGGSRTVETGAGSVLLVIDGEGNVTESKCDPVGVLLQTGENGVYDPSTDTKLYFSENAVNTEYAVNSTSYSACEGKATLDFTGIAPNSLVAVNWKADNGAGLTFYGTENVILADAEVTVKIYAERPTGWSGVAVELVSDVNAEHSLAVELTDTESVLLKNGSSKDYLVLTVPAHLIYSSVKFSEPVSTYAEADTDASITHKLAGATRYFEKDGRYWGLIPYSDAPTSDAAVIETDGGDGEAEYFDLQGIRVAEPCHGRLYIVRKNSRVSKIRF